METTPSITQKSLSQINENRDQFDQAVPYDGSYSDYELNDVLFKLSDARFQLTSEDIF